MVPSTCLEAVSCGVQTVWQDLEVENEMSRGLLPGLVVLSGKLGPTLRTTTQRTLHSVAQVQSVIISQPGNLLVTLSIAACCA